MPDTALYFWIAPLLVAPFVGSFLGVLLRRLPRGHGVWRGVVFGRSACDHCGRTLSPAELVPLASFLALGGRCRGCGARIDPSLPAIEIAAFGVALWAVLALPDAATIWAGCALGWTLLVLGWIDCRHLLLPDVLTLPLALGGLAVTWGLEPEALTDHAAAAVLGYAAFRMLGAAYRRLRGREGLGQGDAKLVCAAGAWIGLAGLPWAIFLAGVLGLLMVGIMRLADGPVGAATRLPFGAPLALAIWLVWLYVPG